MQKIILLPKPKLWFTNFCHEIIKSSLNFDVIPSFDQHGALKKVRKLFTLELSNKLVRVKTQSGKSGRSPLQL